MNADSIALILPDSGNIDRNGNKPNNKHNCLQWLAEALATMGYASLRYDKRGVGASSFHELDYQQMSFDDLLQDAKSWVEFIASRYSELRNVILVGQGEGALIATLVAQLPMVKKVIAISAPSLNTYQLLSLQVSMFPRPFRTQAETMLNHLSQGRLVTNVPEALEALFSVNQQPYLISIMHHEPSQMVAGLNVPLLLVYGSHDIEVGELNGLALEEAQPNAVYHCITGMNHVLKTVGEDYDSNAASYHNPYLPLSSGFLRVIRRFLSSSHDVSLRASGPKKLDRS
ncbi:MULTISPECIES: alpha/beta hydrolase [Vibrio]|uniref:Alpha/beta hydrolase n=1 Tax=Vibrio nitrifigilis TaxID=2789781 RepID=A0ABS0GJH3_9VIBR|nr:alpha/beta hydrolase [Vibrio nitrifigilis]MBF9002572.1 alpha/beta hydrolase [Vibrio nitrifigilis]